MDGSGATKGTGLGSRLMATYAKQLKAKHEITRTPEARCTSSAFRTRIGGQATRLRCASNAVEMAPAKVVPS